MVQGFRLPLTRPPPAHSTASPCRQSDPGISSHSWRAARLHPPGVTAFLQADQKGSVCRSWRLWVLASPFSNEHGPWGLWDGCVASVVGVVGFPLLRASVSPNGGVAGFKQTFLVVARMMATSEECGMMAAVPLGGAFDNGQGEVR